MKPCDAEDQLLTRVACGGWVGSGIFDLERQLQLNLLWKSPLLKQETGYLN